MSGTNAVEIGYARCLEETRRRAANFGLGIRLLPPERRRALSAVYWFSQLADDAADGEGPQADRRARLALVRSELDRTLAGRPPAPPWAAFGDATNNERLQAEGAADRAEARAKQAGEHVKDAGRDAREVFRG